MKRDVAVGLKVTAQHVKQPTGFRDDVALHGRPGERSRLKYNTLSWTGVWKRRIAPDFIELSHHDLHPLREPRKSPLLRPWNYTRVRFQYLPHPLHPRRPVLRSYIILSWDIPKEDSSLRFPVQGTSVGQVNTFAGVRHISASSQGHA
jgi:hypothetical protein